MNKHKSNKIKENSNTVRHLIMGQITTTQNLVAIKEVRHAGQLFPHTMRLHINEGNPAFPAYMWKQQKPTAYDGNPYTYGTMSSWWIEVLI